MSTKNSGKPLAEKEVTRPIRWLQASALTRARHPELLDTLFEHMPLGPLLFPDDVLTDFPRMLNVADIIRNSCFRCLRRNPPRHRRDRGED
jgi:GTPase Era involved in 16S rRNA processing